MTVVQVSNAGLDSDFLSGDSEARGLQADPTPSQRKNTEDRREPQLPMAIVGHWLEQDHQPQFSILHAFQSKLKYFLRVSLGG